MEKSAGVLEPLIKALPDVRTKVIPQRWPI